MTDIEAYVQHDLRHSLNRGEMLTPDALWERFYRRAGWGKQAVKKALATLKEQGHAKEKDGKYGPK